MGKKGKKEVEVISEEVISEEFIDLNIAQLKERSDAASYQYTKSAKERNFMQVEVDLVQRLYDITKSEVKESAAQLIAMDRQMEMMEKDHRVNLKVYEQKVQNLSYENKNAMKEVATGGQEAQEAQDQSHLEISANLERAKTSLKADIKQMELDNADTAAAIRNTHAQTLRRHRESFTQAQEGLEKEYIERCDQLKQDLQLRLKVEIHEIEERKNLHIHNLQKSHNDMFRQIQDYYNDITRDNLDLIKSLKEDIAEQRQRQKKSEQSMIELTAENKSLAEPLQKAESQRADLQQNLRSFEKDQMAVKNLRARAAQVATTLEESKKSTKEEEEKLDKTRQEVADLYKQFSEIARETQVKAGHKNVVLEKKLELLAKDYSSKEAQLGEVLGKANLDPNAMQAVVRKTDDVVSMKNQLIKDLQYRVQRNMKLYNDTISVYEANLVKLGVPEESIESFVKMTTAASTMPAGLVARQP